MCELMEYYIELAIKKEHIEKIQKMIQKHYDKADILDLGYTEEEFEEAEKNLTSCKSKNNIKQE